MMKAYERVSIAHLDNFDEVSVARGIVETFDAGIIRGWAVDLSCQGSAVFCDVWVSGIQAGAFRSFIGRADLQRDELVDGGYGFVFDVFLFGRQFIVDAIEENSGFRACCV
jgi:hypothetical protein